MASFYTAKNLIKVPKKQQLDNDKLINYLRENVDVFPKTGTCKVKKFGFGQSNPTYLLECNNQKYVLRKKPAGKLLPSAHAVNREYRIMTALQNTPVPVPETYHFCSDSSVIGTEFYLCEFMDGRVFKEGTLPSLTKTERYAIYMEYCRVLSEIHSVNINELNLNDYGGSGLYLKKNQNKNKKIKFNIYDHCERFKSIWNKQFQRAKTAEVSQMKYTRQLFNEINAYKMVDYNEIETLIHGDYHFGNIIWDKYEYKILAVIDWEISTIGNPLIDLAAAALIYYFHSPKTKTSPTATSSNKIGYDSFFKGLNGINPKKELGIPTQFEFVKAYFMKLDIQSELIKKIEFPIKDWNYYVALQFFKNIGVFQGIYKRIITGTASNPFKLPIVIVNEYFAQLGLEALHQTDIYERILSVSNDNLLPLHLRTFSSNFSDKFYDIYRKLLYFMDAYIYPNEKKHALWIAQNEENNKFHEVFPGYKSIKQKAKELGLWNMYLNLTNFEYAPICEILGTSPLLAPTSTNCDAPDVPNVYVLKEYATNKQKNKYLKPLLNGTVNSCYGMTEPDVASSDAKNIKCSITKTNDNKYYIINGRKWWTTGASHPNCKFIILMGKIKGNNNNKNNLRKYGQHTMIIVPMDSVGIKIVRKLTVFGYNDGHCEIIFDHVKVLISDALIGTEGDGFKLAQVRLSPARVHHCMRFIGMSEVSLNLMKNRSLSRYAFNNVLSKYKVIQNDIANSRSEIEQCRLLILQAAFMMDKYGNKHRNTRKYISMIKNAVCNTGCNVIDRAIQVFGGKGVSQDTYLPYFYVLCRSLRIGDGPDAVHNMVISRFELNNMTKSKL